MDPGHKRPSDGSTVVGLITANPRQPDRSVVQRTPSNGMSLQLSAYLSTIKPSVNFRQNLAWNYGAFLEEIPQRLGKNKALDTAVAALNFLGVPAGQWTGHCEGAAYMLRARGVRNPLDRFESRLLMSARGSLVEGIFNPVIHFTDDEWRRIVELDVGYESEAIEGKVLRHLASIPGLTQQVKKLPTDRDLVIMQAQSHLAAIGSFLEKTRDQLLQLEADGEQPHNLVASMVHAAVMRAYGFCLAGALVMHRLIHCLDTNNGTAALESAVLVNESLELAERANKYTPFASAHIQFVLAAAYMNAVTDARRQAIKIAISAYQIDCSGCSWTDLHSQGLQWFDDLRCNFDMLVFDNLHEQLRQP
ncbi:hypothetical protein NU219Hw_g643t1 [Hortaea werneckii]